MSAFSRQLREDLTFWGSPTPNGFGGFTFAAPVGCKGRWEDKQELFIDPAGEQLMSSAVAYPAIDVEIGGYLFLGTSAGADPTVVGGARRIQQYAKSPSMRARADEFERKAWL